MLCQLVRHTITNTTIFAAGTSVCEPLGSHTHTATTTSHTHTATTTSQTTLSLLNTTVAACTQVRVSDGATARRYVQQLSMAEGVALEIVEQPEAPVATRLPGADTLEPMALLLRYFALRDAEDEAAPGAAPRADVATREAAQAVLQSAIDGTPRIAQAGRDVAFESVEVQGFGSFGVERAVRYPLAGRGVVLVMGR